MYDPLRFNSKHTILLEEALCNRFVFSEKGNYRWPIDTKAVTVMNATTGLRIAAEILWDGCGMRSVALPAMTFHATVNAFRSRKWTIELVDCDQYGVIDPGSIKRIPDVIVPVGLFGNSCQDCIAKSREFFPDTFILEDASQHYMSTDEKSGNVFYGDMAIVSFDPTKNISSPMGNGGAIFYKYVHEFKFTDHSNKSDAITVAIQRGIAEKLLNHNPKSEHNKEKAKLASIECAMIWHELSVWLDKDQEKRKEIFDFLKKECDKKGIHVPVNLRGFGYQKFPIALTPNDGFKVKFEMASAMKSIRYYRSSDITWLNLRLVEPYQKEDYPMSESYLNEIKFFPFHPFMTDDEIEELRQAISNF